MHEKDPVAIDNVTLMHFHFELFFMLLDHYDSVKIYEPSRPEVINVECVYETCLHGVTLIAENSKLLQTNRVCVYFDVNIDVGFASGDGLRLKFRHQMLVRPLQSIGKDQSVCKPIC